MQQGAMNSPHEFLDCADVALSFTSIFVSRCRVEHFSTIGQISLKELKFAIHESLYHLEPRSSVDLHHHLNHIDQGPLVWLLML